MRSQKVIIVGAGIGGLTAAALLAAAGIEVTVYERGGAPGGKMREVEVGGARIDSGPTVLTMRWVFDEIFDQAGGSLDSAVALHPAQLLARHAWNDQDRLDLFADVSQSADAIADFSGSAEAERFLAFAERAKNVYQTLETSYLQTAQPSPLSLVRHAGVSGLGDLTRINPFSRLWDALGDYFHDLRLQQLFGRYATYCGSSPYEAPATLMLVSHVEQAGVWLPEGGMQRLADALAALAEANGARFQYNTSISEITVDGSRATGVTLDTGERLDADTVLVNADATAVGSKLLGKRAARAASPLPKNQRSLSALTWSLTATAKGFPLARHSVFFSENYADEFKAIFDQGKVPAAPTIYVCAQDRDDRASAPDTGEERLFCLINAPALGDIAPLGQKEIEQCEERTFAILDRYGLKLDRRPERTRVTTPADFNRLFPGTGGALYGRANHGWRASFQRPGARTKIPGLYLTGGSTHPGPGVPMAALSGRIAAAAVMADLDSTNRSRRTGISGGTSMRSATTAAMD